MRVKRGLNELRDFAPDVLVVWPESFVELQFNVWKSYFSHSRHRIAILARHNGGNPLPDTSIPIFLEDEGGLTYSQAMRVDSIKVVLYPTHRQRIRKAINAFSRQRNVFIGHGDSDKASSSRDYHRIFDRIFVADPNARLRYKQSRFRDDHFTLIGAPYPNEVESSESIKTVSNVLYAPTWEGNQSDNRFTSICIVDAAFEQNPSLAEGLSLNVLPHPLAGSRDNSVNASLRNLIRKHRFTVCQSKAEAFNNSDAIVTDISGVLSEYLATRKPIVVVNLKNQEFARAWDTSQLPEVAALWDPTVETLSDALLRANDSAIRTARQKLAHAKYLGATHPSHAWETFDRAIDHEIREQSVTNLCQQLRILRKRTYKLNPLTAAKAVARLILRRPSRPLS